MTLNTAARLVVGAGKYEHITPVLRDVLQWLSQYVSGYCIRWLLLPWTVSAALAQPTFNRSACQSPTSLVGRSAERRDMLVSWTRTQLADGVSTLQLYSCLELTAGTVVLGLH